MRRTSLVSSRVLWSLSLAGVCSLAAASVGCTIDTTTDASDSGDTGTADDTGTPDDTAADTGVDTGADTGVDTAVDTGADTGADTGSDAGSLDADLGFRPTPNGFAFENYGSDTPATNLTPVELRRMFGDSACSTTSGGTCVLTPAASKWMEGRNKDMGGGHCEGFATLSLLLFKKTIPLTDFGASATGTSDLPFADNEKLQREIAYWFTTQFTAPTSKSTPDMTPTEVVQKLSDAFHAGDETYTIGIFKRKEPYDGHAITPYKVEDKGGGLVQIGVYDNNFPGAERTIDVDTAANTWKYFASTSPSVTGSLYEGDATTKSLAITPTSARLKPQDCAFCGEAQPDGTVKGSVSKFRQLTLEGNGNLLIVDDAGKKLGYDGATFVDDITGADFSKFRSKDLWNNEHEPTYYLPFGSDLTVTVDGASLTAASVSDLTMVMPAFTLAVQGIVLQPGERDQVVFSKDGTDMTYTTAGLESADLVLGSTTPGADYEIVIHTLGESAGQTVTLHLDLPKQRLAFSVKGATTSSYDITVDRIDDAGLIEFTHSAAAAAPGDTMYLNYGTWTADHMSMTLDTDKGTTGTITSTVVLTDSH